MSPKKVLLIPLLVLRINKLHCNYILLKTKSQVQVLKTTLTNKQGKIMFIIAATNFVATSVHDVDPLQGHCLCQKISSLFTKKSTFSIIPHSMAIVPGYTTSLSCSTSWFMEIEMNMKILWFWFWSSLHANDNKDAKKEPQLEREHVTCVRCAARTELCEGYSAYHRQALCQDSEAGTTTRLTCCSINQ